MHTHAQQVSEAGCGRIFTVYQTCPIEDFARTLPEPWALLAFENFTPLQVPSIVSQSVRGLSHLADCGGRG